MPDSLTDLAGLFVDAEDFLGAVLETAAQPIWVVDPDDRYPVRQSGRNRPERCEGVARSEATVAHLLHMSSKRLAG